MLTKSKSDTTAAIPPIIDTERSVLDAVVARRLALRLGLPLAVASVLAELHGLGPSGRRAH